MLRLREISREIESNFSLSYAYVEVEVIESLDQWCEEISESPNAHKSV